MIKRKARNVKCKVELKSAKFLILIFSFAFYVLCFALPYFAQAQLSNQQEINAEDENTWDFGRIKPGEILEHSFMLKNDTDKILNIKDINTSCGCTIPEIKKRTLGPQESAEITVKFNSKGYSGPVKQFIYVNTDNLDNPVLRFIIKAEVIK